jgi:penicillin G amidase
MNFDQGLTWLKFGKRLPCWDGDMRGAPTHESMHIDRDRYGIPSISALNIHDAWFGLGFCQGQDRAFQLEIYKRQVRGTLSEMFGERTLPADRLSRVIGFSRIANSYMKHLDQETSEILEGYTAGLNFGVTHGFRKKPHEFEILGCAPTRFEKQDVIGLILLLTFSLSHWMQKITRLKLLQEGGEEILKKLDPGYADWNYLIKPVNQIAHKSDQLLTDDIQEAMKYLSKPGLSNNWVISPSLTKSGNTILANDPHLGAEIPAPWYLSQIQWPGNILIGAVYPGTPLFLIGTNSHVSWGLTAAFLDNIDLFIEKISKDGFSFKEDGKAIKLEQIEETIQIRGAKPERLVIQKTTRGPLLSPLYHEELPPLSFCAIWMKPGPVDGFFKMHTARRVEDIKSIFNQWPLVSLNLVCGDTQGNIGWYHIGKVPRRKKTNGLLPLPGWDSRYYWEDKAITLPYLFNPKPGYIATANNKPIADSKTAFLGYDYIDGYRHARIIEMLSKQGKKIDLAICQEMQADVKSSVWSQIRDIIINLNPADKKTVKIISILKEWDGTVTHDSVAATIFEYLIAEITHFIIDRISGDKSRWIRAPFLDGVGGSTFGMSRISQVVELVRSHPTWIFGPDYQAQFCTLVVQACRKISEDNGDNTDKWQWGKVRPFYLNHLLCSLAGSPVDKKYSDVFNAGPFTINGDEQCVSVAAGDMLDPRVTPTFIPNLRMIIELGDVQYIYVSLAGGISGNPFSSHYSDLLDLWLRGTGITLNANSTEIPKHHLVFDRDSRTQKNEEY